MPDYVPKLLVRDDARCAMITEFLGGYELMRTALAHGNGTSSAAVDVASFMARTHARTHAIGKKPGHWDSWAHLTNEPMCGITAEFVFSKPLDASDPTNNCPAGLEEAAAALRNDAAACTAVAALKHMFLTRKECLVHGDLHTGSVMVPTAGASGHAKVIDAEFAHFGCAAFDVGTFFANLFFAWVACEAAEARAHIVGMMAAMWGSYRDQMKAAQPSPLATPESEADLLSLSAGMAGCELIRRVVGAAHVADLESITDPVRKLRAEKVALAAGRALVTSYQTLTGFDALLDCAMAAEKSVT